METSGPASGMTDQAASRVVGADRVLAVLTELARHPQGAALEELSRAVAAPKPTVHRALAALRRSGFAQLDAPGHYVLGDELLRVAFAHHDARPDHLRVGPVLEELAARYGETAHYAVLDGDQVVYRSKAEPPPGGVRLSTTVGGRNLAHATAVGKLLLACTLPDDDAVRAWMRGRTLAAPTAATLTTADRLVPELAAVRSQGYAVDDEEGQAGVVCLALPVHLTGRAVPSGAVSVSAVRYRTPLEVLLADLPAIRAILAPLTLHPGGQPQDRP